MTDYSYHPGSPEEPDAVSHAHIADRSDNSGRNNSGHHGGHGGAGHYGHNHHDISALTRQRLWIALFINLAFLIIEVIGGLITNSLALLADAGHMLTDVAALLLAVFVARLAERPATPKRTYGLLRAEVLGAFVNGATLMVIVVIVFREAWHRFGSTPEIDGPLMLGVAVAGLAANIASAWVLYSHRSVNLNIRGAFLHMMADALGSVGAIVAGLVIWLTGWMPIDPIASVVIGLLILWSGWGLISQTMNILLEGVPEHIDSAEVRGALMDVAHVTAVHDLHIWTIGTGMPSLSAHIELEDVCSESRHWQCCLLDAQMMLKERFGISHSTLQVEPENFECERPHE